MHFAQSPDQPHQSEFIRCAALLKCKEAHNKTLAFYLSQALPKARQS